MSNYSRCEGDASAKSLLPGSHTLAFVWSLPEKLPGTFHDYSSQDMILADKYVCVVFFQIRLIGNEFNLIRSNVFRTFDSNRFPHIQYSLTAFVDYDIETSCKVNAFDVPVEEAIAEKKEKRKACMRVEKSVEFFVAESYFASNTEQSAITRLVFYLSLPSVQ